MKRLLLLLLLGACHSPGRPSEPYVSALWPHGFGQPAPGTDSVTVCALVTMPDGELLAGRTAAHFQVRGDSARFVVVDGGACNLPFPRIAAVRWVIGTTRQGHRVPHPQALAPVPFRDRAGGNPGQSYVIRRADG